MQIVSDKNGASKQKVSLAQKLELVEQQEREVNERIERLEAEKKEAFTMFRQLLAEEKLADVARRYARVMVKRIFEIFNFI